MPARNRASTAVALFVLLACAALAGCGGGASAGAPRSSPMAALPGVDGTRWLWVEADCSDGDLEIARLGFERELSLSVGDGNLLLTFETELPTTGCSATSVWLARPASDTELWRLEPQAVVSLPPDGECGARERDPTLGSLRLSSDLLEIVTQRSDWCRGFDARFVYRRVGERRLSDQQLVARYVAHFNRGDAAELSALFVDSGSLVEPFTRTSDGNYKRHDGQAALRAFYNGAFASTPWHALRLLGLTPGPDGGHVTADWEYMDANLAEPMRGRNLFVLAGGEIYETEIQLVSDPKPSAAAAQGAWMRPARSE